MPKHIQANIKKYINNKNKRKIVFFIYEKCKCNKDL